MNRLYLGKYPPLGYPAPRDPPAGMGVEAFDLYPAGFANGAICNDGVFHMLDAADALDVRHTRLYWATRNQQDAAISAPFLDIARSKWHG
ncbi:hypothetical protein [Rhodanobacter soli]|uniref:Uncharacterized protein n=1 Tax=Rhodanobacter soli TaxID=590609 RepID=A0ABV2PT87_9GAMM